jgi:hypothetical protein
MGAILVRPQMEPSATGPPGLRGPSVCSRGLREGSEEEEVFAMLMRLAQYGNPGGGAGGGGGGYGAGYWIVVAVIAVVVVTLIALGIRAYRHRRSSADSESTDRTQRAA